MLPKLLTLLPLCDIRIVVFTSLKRSVAMPLGLEKVFEILPLSLINISLSLL